MEQKYGKTLN